MTAQLAGAADLLTAAELHARLQSVGDRFYHHRHPFHLRMHEGKLTRGQLQAWALNRYYYQSRIPIKDSIILSRSDDPEFRRAACEVPEFFVDVKYEQEVVRARFVAGALQLHEGGGSFVTLPPVPFDKSQVSPARDSRLRWMQSVVHCTHYIAGAGEKAYLRPGDAPEITFVDRDPIDRSDEAYCEVTA